MIPPDRQARVEDWWNNTLDPKHCQAILDHRAVKVRLPVAGHSLLARDAHAHRRFYDRRLVGEANDLWPPLIFWPKCRFPKHPRQAREPGSILLWRNAKALDAIAPLAPLVLPLVTRPGDVAERGAVEFQRIAEGAVAVNLIPAGLT